MRRVSRANVSRAFPLLLLLAVVLHSCTTDSTRRDYLRAGAKYLAPPANPVILIPGFGVTRLLDPKIDPFPWGTPRSTMHTVWPDDLDLPVDFATNSIGRDRLEPRGYVGSRGPINTGWQLMVALQKFGGYSMKRDVYPFYYDWRLSAMDNAQNLEAFAASIRRAHNGAKVDVVTHSAGSMIAMAWVKLAGGDDDVRNLVLVAPPAGGVVDAFRVMVRPEKFVRRVLTSNMVATWPFVPDLLPEDGKIFLDEEGRALDLDVWSPETWAHFQPYSPQLQPVFSASLARARAFRDRLRATPMPPAVSLHMIGGDCVPTARRVITRKDGTFVFYPDELRPSETKLRAQIFEDGDGTVPRSSAVAEGDVEFFCDGHQGMTVDPNVHRALIRILRAER